jgi:hypothetical protein
MDTITSDISDEVSDEGRGSGDLEGSICLKRGWGEEKGQQTNAKPRNGTNKIDTHSGDNEGSCV